MGFLTPASFWFLSFIAILILFYFFKKQFDRRVVSSVYLWEQTVKEWESNRWWRKLQRSLLLLLQILVMLFLIFALARPFVSVKGVSGDHLVIILDTSASMAVKGKAGTRFDQAKQKALSLVDQLTGKQAVTLIDAKRVPELLETKTYDHSKVKADIRDMSLSYQQADLAGSVQLAESLAHGHGEIDIFTDDLSEKQLNGLKLDAKLKVHNVGISQPNLSLRAFGVRAQGNRVSAIITVKNEGKQSKKTTVSILNDGKRLKQVKKEIPGGQQVTMTVKNLPEKGVYTAKIDQKDAFSQDNRRWAFLSDKRPKTLYLAGEVSTFLSKALQYSGAKIIQITKNKDGNYYFPENVESGAIYVLADVPADEWPDGAKLIVSPRPEGPFHFKKKISLKYRLKKVSDNPMVEYVNVKNVYLGKAYPVGKLNELVPIIKSGKTPIISKGNFDGAKTVLFSFDIKDSDWPLHPSFPILVENALNYLSQHDESLGYLLPGENQKITLTPTVKSVKVETNVGQSIAQLDLKQPVLKAPNKPGLYKIVEQTASGPRLRYFSVTTDERELTAQSSPSFTISQSGATQSSGSQTGIIKHGLCRWAALLVLLFLFVEWEVYRRGIAGR